MSEEEKWTDKREKQSMYVVPVKAQVQVYHDVLGTAKVDWEQIVKDVEKELKLGRNPLTVAKKMAAKQDEYVDVWVE